ncbi:restriction endonuclease subunit S [Campylobacter upsaliensis]|nr:restriction endonuclease subunit S [Campylobacter upsaliensis]ELK0695707.1 restriction endonuclease subunit S [Campylobacter upsaliensis]
MKTDTLKKSLLDYAIKGKLTARFRRENNGLNAFDELEIYNDKIKQKRKNLEKELKTLEFKLKKASTRHCETSAGSRGKTSEAVQGVAEAGFFSNPQTKHELKSQIQSLKKELAKCKEITPLNLSEAPFEIPNTWAWVKLGDICEMKKGPFGSAITKDMFIPNGSNAVKIYEQKNAIQKSETLGEYYISLEHFEKLKQFEVFENDIIVSCAGTIGEIFRIPKNAPKGIINQALMKIKLVNEEWIPYFMIFFDFLIKQKSQENSKGSAIKNIPPLDILKNFTIPLPPLREQQEIVKKLDLLVSLANDFAITKENLKRIEKRIEKSLLKLALEGSLSKLYRRSSPTLSAFDEINTYNDNIKEKRKDLEKELKKCEKELKLEKEKDKKAFFKSQIQMLKKELTKCKEITPLNLSEAPFEIPNTWAWVKLGDICEMKKGPFGSAITKDMFIPNGNNAVKIYEQKNAIQKSETLGEYYISLEHFEKLKQFEVFENDIIVSCAGTIGEIFRIPKNAPKGIINQALMKIKLVNEEWIPYFMIFFDFLIKQKSQENSKGSAIKNIPPLDILKNFSIPLPPLKEQEYITQILDTLFTLKKGLRVD